MTVIKKHTRPDNTRGDCEAGADNCPYGGADKHFYYDSSIKKNVLDPESTTQKKLNQLSADELTANANKLVGPKTETEEYKTSLDAYEKAQADYEAKKEAIVSSYPEPKQEFVKQLLDSPDEQSLVGSFEIWDAPTRSALESTIGTEKERTALAKSYLNKVKTEGKYRALVSSYLVK